MGWAGGICEIGACALGGALKATDSEGGAGRAASGVPTGTFVPSGIHADTAQAVLRDAVSPGRAFGTVEGEESVQPASITAVPITPALRMFMLSPGRGRWGLGNPP